MALSSDNEKGLWAGFRMFFCAVNECRSGAVSGISLKQNKTELVVRESCRALAMLSGRDGNEHGQKSDRVSKEGGEGAENGVSESVKQWTCLSDATRSARGRVFGGDIVK